MSIEHYESAILTEIRGGLHSASAGYNVAKTVTGATTEETVVLGSSTDLWNQTWIASDFSDANFFIY